MKRRVVLLSLIIITLLSIQTIANAMVPDEQFNSFADGRRDEITITNDDYIIFKTKLDIYKYPESSEHDVLKFYIGNSVRIKAVYKDWGYISCIPSQLDIHPLIGEMKDEEYGSISYIYADKSDHGPYYTGWIKMDKYMLESRIWVIPLGIIGVAFWLCCNPITLIFVIAGIRRKKRVKTVEVNLSKNQKEPNTQVNLSKHNNISLTKRNK